ncbi:MAG: 50S ribosomal protein L25 [Phycisphaerae bacterium]
MVATTEHNHHTLEVAVRSVPGPKGATHLRKSGKVPGVVYGLAKENVPIELDAKETERAIHSGSHLVGIKLNGTIEHVLIQDVQYDHLQMAITHVDFMRIDPTHKVRVKVPVDFRGIPKGAKEGGILEVQIAELDVEVLPLEIPDRIRFSVEHLEIHGLVHAREIPLPAGVKLLNPVDQILCQVRTVKEVEPEVAAVAGPAEPEVIGKKPVEDAEGAAAGPAAAGKAAPTAKKEAKEAPAKK